jgi:hypothetical protein
MLKIPAVLMLGSALALPSIGTHRLASNVSMSLEMRALELGFRTDLIEELVGVKCTCACDFVTNSFPKTFDCNAGTTKLTETVACGGGASTCTISGNMNWDPVCGPACCGSGNDKWKDGSFTSGGSFAEFRDSTGGASGPGTFSNCTPGDFYGSSGSSLQTACDAEFLLAGAEIHDCTSTGIPPVILVWQNITWVAAKVYSCSTVGR